MKQEGSSRPSLSGPADTPILLHSFSLGDGDGGILGNLRATPLLNIYYACKRCAVWSERYTPMPQHLFDGWCECATKDITKNRRLHTLTERANGRTKMRGHIVATVHSHYEDPKFLAERLKKHGFKRASKILEKLLPVTKAGRSGHLGEIFATESVAVIAPTFIIPVKRLRWLDGRDTAMRGEDVLGVAIEKGRVRFLKGESKSRANLTPAVVKEARAALLKNSGRPSQHALGFVMRRLQESGQEQLALVFEDHLLSKTISRADVVHLIFGFSGNDASNALESDLMSYAGEIEQHAVNLYLNDHQAFIASVYDK